jgi:hypothetical protein
MLESFKPPDCDDDTGGMTGIRKTTDIDGLDDELRSFFQSVVEYLITTSTSRDAYRFLLSSVKITVPSAPFLHQIVDGDVYYVSETMTPTTSWALKESIVAFFNADSNESTPNPILKSTLIQIIAAASPPKGINNSWIKQYNSLCFVKSIVDL